MPLEIAAHAGFCMGVRRAVEAAEQAARDGIPTCTLGELIHNHAVVEQLTAQGIPPVNSPEEARGRRVLIRSHGVSPKVLDTLTEMGCEILDLTCPFVDKLHRIVERESALGTPVILAGEKDHPEVTGTAGWSHTPVTVVRSLAEAEALPEMACAVLCAQTTFQPEKWSEIVAALEKRVRQLRVWCTICSATRARQEAAKELAMRSDAMIVVGGRHSANTVKLYDTCRACCPRTILVERAAEIPPGFAYISDKIGITAGASTPDGSLKEVVTHYE